MANYPTIERQEIIKDYINGIYRTKKEIIQRLKESDLGVVPKTVERDLKFLKNQGYEIEYIRGSGYILKHSEEFVSELLNRIKKVSKLKKTMDDKTGLSEYILDNSVQMEGIDLIPEIFKGLEEKRYIEFVHTKHGSQTSKDYKVIPLWLKEYDDYWYIIALPIGEKIVKSFGLDRIKHLKLMNLYDESLITEDITEQIDNYNYRLGVSYPTFRENPKREIIKLAVSDFLLPYWKSKPVHQTQRITNEKIETKIQNKLKGYTMVYFTLIPNLDLIKLIVSGVGDIKLIEPKHLKAFIQKEYKGLMKDIF
ncbi:MAG: WYL domain-containing protein [Flavobacteriaceae bacterium]|nr:WYL domain-containing protein [Flavobacteriaceae bacterium]